MHDRPTLANGPADRTNSPRPWQEPVSPTNSWLATAGLSFAMILLGLIPVPTAALFKVGATALEISTARSIVAAGAALLVAIAIGLVRSVRSKRLLTKETTVVAALCASIGVGIVFFISGYAYIAALEAGLHVSYALLTVATVAMMVARFYESHPVSDRYVFGLTMLLVLAALMLGTNVIGEASTQLGLSWAGFALAAISGFAFGLLPRSLFAARALDSTLLLGIGFTISAAAQIVLLFGLVALGLDVSLVLLPAMQAGPDLQDPSLIWTLVNGIVCTYLPYAIANWSKRRGVTDSAMAFAYQLEPATATMIAAPIIGQPVTANVLLCCVFAFLAFVLFAKHEAQLSMKSS